MPLYTDPGFRGLADRFNLRTDGSSSNIAGGAPAVGKSFLNSNEGAGASFALFKNLADPGKQRGLSNAFQDNYNQYKAAVALQPTLQYTDWLNQVSPDALYKSLDFFTRGERPSAYQGKYKFIGGG